MTIAPIAQEWQAGTCSGYASSIIVARIQMGAALICLFA